VVPETRLALELKGVIAGADGTSGGAIIADKKDERFFPVGAALPGGVVLEKVYPLEVLLLRNGRQETLKLVRETLEGDASEGAAKPSSSPKAAGVVVADANVKSDFLGANPGGINKAVRVRPIFRGGKLKGFRISPGRNRKVFAELGFRAGDLLTKVDGIAPADPKAVFAVLNGLQDRGSVSVEVTRRGRPVTLELKAP
jgi:general secretion pathway protein C